MKQQLVIYYHHQHRQSIDVLLFHDKKGYQETFLSDDLRLNTPEMIAQKIDEKLRLKRMKSTAGIHLIIDSKQVRTHWMQLPKMPQKAVRRIVFKELRLLYQDIQMYHIVFKTHITAKKYLMIQCELIDKDILSYVADIAKKLKKSLTKKILLSDAYANLLPNQKNYFVLYMQHDYWILGLKYQGIYRQLYVESHAYHLLVSRMDVLLGHVQAVENQIDAYQFILIKDRKDVKIDIDHMMLESYNWEVKLREDIFNDLVVKSHKISKDF